MLLRGTSGFCGPRKRRLMGAQEGRRVPLRCPPEALVVARAASAVESRVAVRAVSSVARLSCHSRLPVCGSPSLPPGPRRGPEVRAAHVRFGSGDSAAHRERRSTGFQPSLSWSLSRFIFSSAYPRALQKLQQPKVPCTATCRAVGGLLPPPPPSWGPQRVLPLPCYAWLARLSERYFAICFRKGCFVLVLTPQNPCCLWNPNR